MRGKWMLGLGLVLIVLDLLFLFAIFPMLTKMPADYEQTYNFEGSVQVFVAEYNALVPIETKMTRVLEATGVTDDDVLLLNQDITFFPQCSLLRVNNYFTAFYRFVIQFPPVRVMRTNGIYVCPHFNPRSIK